MKITDFHGTNESSSGTLGYKNLMHVKLYITCNIKYYLIYNNLLKMYRVFNDDLTLVITFFSVEHFLIIIFFKY